MDRFKESKQAGRRLLVNYIDAIAVENPTKVVFTQIISFDPPVQFEVTYQALSNIINCQAWQLTESLHGKARNTTIAYIGPSDARHLILSLAAVKAGSRLLLLSPRNSVAIHEHLIKETQSSGILYDSSFSTTVSEMTALGQLTAVQAPELVDLLSDTTIVNEYPYWDTFQDASDKPLVLFHTSGSTGMPKPVTFVHAAMASADNFRDLYSKVSYRVSAQKVIDAAQGFYNGCPLFHLAGYVVGFFAVFSGCVVVIPPPNQPSSPQMFKQVMHATHVEGALLPPLVVDQIAQDPAMVEEVAKLKFITFGGGKCFTKQNITVSRVLTEVGSLSRAAGDLLAKKTHMLNVLGSSECGTFGVFMTEPEHWDWFHFAEEEMGIEWEPIDKDTDKPELFELVLRRRDLPQRQAVFANFPDLDEWHTKDIFLRHPTIPYYYKYQSRKDDVIVFSTGEKTNPIDVEAAITSLPGVEASIVVGHKRQYPILLVELADSATADETLPRIHKALEELNKLSMKYAQIHRGDVLIVPSEKPFVRTPKGTINRSQTNKLYAEEIQAQYDSATDIPDQALQTKLDPSTDETLAKTIADMVGDLTGVKDLGINDDFFASGLDSRQVQILAAALTRSLPEQNDILFIRNAVYMNPTASGLVDHIRRNAAEDVSATLDALFDKYDALPPYHQVTNSDRYSSLLPQPAKATPPSARKDAHHILLTGNTGFVGGFILQCLLQRSVVTEITCINRRLPDANSASNPAIVVNHFKGDLSQPFFGLHKDAYAHLVSSVTEVIHCQWPVTFNLPLALFEPQIAGIANLVQMAYDSPQDARIIFLSSIATIQGWDQGTPVPEAPLNSLQYAQGGYGQSKMLASKLLGQATTTSGVPCAVCRVGQVGGPINADGKWPERDWFPTLLRASEIMGVLPKSIGHFDDVDWLPVDSLSEALVTLALDLDDLNSAKTGPAVDGGAAYYHFTNPSVSPYPDLAPVLARRLAKSNPNLELVDTLLEWTERLAAWTPASSGADTDAERSKKVESSMAAATALLEFYQGLARNLDQPNVMLDTALTAERIPSLKSVGAVSEAWIELWLDQWGFGK
ncbi:NRPS-like enzyme [Aspergillus mulundensis]|uniref:NRPS-like enzyme n=1 Tax=Aspergillus mulundensis TaxID=1810919 RepID=A0A3D8SK31_9EURO|nr:NRPS-like enzyme [Aspergillus mulundensis]RDW86636.1 NRPS-like enzyme [Aspergillus mulundensis]